MQIIVIHDDVEYTVFGTFGKKSKEDHDFMNILWKTYLNQHLMGFLIYLFVLFF